MIRMFWVALGVVAASAETSTLEVQLCPCDHTTSGSLVITVFSNGTSVPFSMELHDSRPGDPTHFELSDSWESTPPIKVEVKDTEEGVCVEQVVLHNRDQGTTTAIQATPLWYQTTCTGPIAPCDSPCVGRHRWFEASCGNGFLQDSEECDDGNTKDGDGCSRNCQAEADIGKCLCENPIEHDYVLPWTNNIKSTEDFRLVRRGHMVGIVFVRRYVNGRVWSPGPLPPQSDVDSIPFSLRYSSGRQEDDINCWTANKGKEPLGPCYQRCSVDVPTPEWEVEYDQCLVTQTLWVDPSTLPEGCWHDPLAVDDVRYIIICEFQPCSLSAFNPNEWPTTEFTAACDRYTATIKVDREVEIDTSTVLVTEQVTTFIGIDGSLLANIYLQFGDSGWRINPDIPIEIITVEGHTLYITTKVTDTMFCLASIAPANVYADLLEIRVPVVNTQTATASTITVSLTLQGRKEDASFVLQLQPNPPTVEVQNPGTVPRNSELVAGDILKVTGPRYNDKTSLQEVTIIGVSPTVTHTLVRNNEPLFDNVQIQIASGSSTEFIFQMPLDILGPGVWDIYFRKITAVTDMQQISPQHPNDNSPIGKTTPQAVPTTVSVTAIDKLVWRITSKSSTCGNGVLEYGEECDDRDTKSGDGCNESCEKEDLEPPDNRCVCDGGENDVFAVRYDQLNWNQKPLNNMRCAMVATDGKIRIEITRPLIYGGLFHIGRDIPDGALLPDALVADSYPPGNHVLNPFQYETPVYPNYGFCKQPIRLNVPNVDWDIEIQGCYMTQTFTFDPLEEPLPFDCIRMDKDGDLLIKCGIPTNLIRAADPTEWPTQRVYLWQNRLQVEVTVKLDVISQTTMLQYVVQQQSVRMNDDCRLQATIYLIFGDSNDLHIDPSGTFTVVNTGEGGTSMLYGVVTEGDVVLAGFERGELLVESRQFSELFDDVVLITVPLYKVLPDGTREFHTIAVNQTLQGNCKMLLIEGKLPAITPVVQINGLEVSTPVMGTGDNITLLGPKIFPANPVVELIYPEGISVTLASETHTNQTLVASGEIVAPPMFNVTWSHDIDAQYAFGLNFRMMVGSGVWYIWFHLSYAPTGSSPVVTEGNEKNQKFALQEQHLRTSTFNVKIKVIQPPSDEEGMANSPDPGSSKPTTEERQQFTGQYQKPHVKATNTSDSNPAFPEVVGLEETNAGNGAPAVPVYILVLVFICAAVSLALGWFLLHLYYKNKAPTKKTPPSNLEMQGGEDGNL